MSGSMLLALLLLFGFVTAITSAAMWFINHQLLGLYVNDTTTSTLDKVGTYTYVVVIVMLVTLSVIIVSQFTTTRTPFHTGPLLTFLLVSLIGAVALTIVPQYYQHQIHILEHPDALGGSSTSLLNFGIETVILLLGYSMVIFVACIFSFFVVHYLKGVFKEGFDAASNAYSNAIDKQTRIDKAKIDNFTNPGKQFDEIEKINAE